LIDYVYPEIGESIVFLLNRAGYRVDLPEQKCCGAPALYMGLDQSAKKMAVDNLVHLVGKNDSYDYIVTACPTGTVMLKKSEPAANKIIDFIQLFHMLQKENSSPKKDRSIEIKKEMPITYHLFLPFETGLWN